MKTYSLNVQKVDNCDEAKMKNFLVYQGTRSGCIRVQCLGEIESCRKSNSEEYQ